MSRGIKFLFSIQKSRSLDKMFRLIEKHCSLFNTDSKAKGHNVAVFHIWLDTEVMRFS